MNFIKTLLRNVDLIQTRVTKYRVLGNLLNLLVIPEIVIVTP